MPGSASWSGNPSIKGSTESMRMVLLTFCLIGLQFTWGTEMTYGTPYLLQLGLTKSRTSLVWIAGPLSGLIMQPVVGAYADRSTSRYGRRRPYIIVGAAITGVGLLLLGWTSEVVGLFVPEGETRNDATIVLAVLCIYALDFSVNAVQACCRSLIVDTLPVSQQQAGSAWASRLTAAGHLLGYFIGTFDLVKIFPGWLGGNTQFKKMTVISALALWITTGVTSWAVSERVRLAGDEDRASIKDVLANLWHRTLNLPPRIQCICWVQFWNWVGWFPFLFYSSTFVGEIYYRYEHPAPEAGSKDEHDALGNIGRLGSMALVIFSLITFGSSVLLPYIIRSPEGPQEKFTPRPPASLAKAAQTILVKAHKLQPDLTSAWMYSNLLFAVITIYAPFVRSLAAATALVAFCGVPWAVSCWAPFGLLGIEINKNTEGPRANVHGSNVPGYTAVRGTADEDEDDDIEMEEGHTGVLRINHPDESNAHSSTGELAGIYLGVLNVYTTLPQFVGTFVSWIVFSLLEPGGNDHVADEDPDHHRWLNLKKNAPNAIAICMFIGALCSVVAAVMARRLKKLL
ncbi:major facilitator superfamily domain-containing protein [Exophiala viscosa]|uniref:Major facilitator superfamily domain-containing protein n=1 Tax=Exophiala viscosa TaxID=2486360 RepID=A0AAN6E4B6_9EURO|nr:major facilitator superfamily domain-containing protein [Exophiala viscosa]